MRRLRAAMNLRQPQESSRLFPSGIPWGATVAVAPTSSSRRASLLLAWHGQQLQQRQQPTMHSDNRAKKATTVPTTAPTLTSQHSEESPQHTSSFKSSLRHQLPFFRERVLRKMYGHAHLRLQRRGNQCIAPCTRRRRSQPTCDEGKKPRSYLEKKMGVGQAGSLSS